MKQIHAPAARVFNCLTGFTRKLGHPAGLSLVVITMLCGSCFRHFYSTNTTRHIDSATLVKLINAQKYFILHDMSHDRQYTLHNIKLSEDSLTAETGPLLSEHSWYEHPDGAHHNPFPVKDQDIVLYEVHMYSQNPGRDTAQVHIPFRDFTRIDVYALDKKSTNRAMVGSIIGVTLTTAAVIGVIVAASETSTKTSTPPPNTNDKVSCSPQVYVTDHNRFEVQGTLYSGAIAASLQRTDYMPLTLEQHATDKIRLTIKGRDEEDIMLSSVQLMQVTHKKTDHVLIDRQGKILVYGEPVLPSQALIGENQDIRSTITARDGVRYSFTNQTLEGNSSDIQLSFRKPLKSTSGKLILNAKNSNWSYYLFNQFKSLYGDYYPSLIGKKDKADPAQVMRCELDQYLPLLVSVKYKDSWKFVDYFPTAGVSAGRDLIMNLDLTEFKDSSYIQVRLQTTYMFWDLDYAAMDFSAGEVLRTEIIPASRISLVNRDNESVPADAENQHADIFVKGPLRLDLEFTIHSSPAPGMSNSYFLVGDGYYHDNSRYDGKARYGELSRFTGKGAFDKYSREKFEYLLHAMGENEHPATISSK